LSVGNGKGHGAQVVGHYAGGDVHLLVAAVGCAGEFADFADDGLEDIGVVVRSLAFERADKAFEAHAGVDDALRKGLERTVFLAVVLHEHEVPDFDDLGMVFVHERGSVHLGALAVGTAVDVNFGAGSAGTGVAHFPEVVVLIAIDDVGGGEVACPELGGLVVAAESLGGAAFEHGDIEAFGIEAEFIYEKTVGQLNGFFFEVIAEAPVAEHFEHGVVVGVAPHLFEVVVLAADAQTLLGIADAAAHGNGVAENDVFELIHAGVGEHQSGVVLDDHRGTGHHGVAVLPEISLETLSDFVCFHIKLCCS